MVEAIWRSFEHRCLYLVEHRVLAAQVPEGRPLPTYSLHRHFSQVPRNLPTPTRVPHMPQAQVVPWLMEQQRDLWKESGGRARQQVHMVPLPPWKPIPRCPA